MGTVLPTHPDPIPHCPRHYQSQPGHWLPLQGQPREGLLMVGPELAECANSFDLKCRATGFAPPSSFSVTWVRFASLWAGLYVSSGRGVFSMAVWLPTHTICSLPGLHREISTCILLYFGVEVVAMSLPLSIPANSAHVGEFLHTQLPGGLLRLLEWSVRPCKLHSSATEHGLIATITMLWANGIPGTKSTYSLVFYPRSLWRQVWGVRVRVCMRVCNLTIS